MARTNECTNAVACSGRLRAALTARAGDGLTLLRHRFRGRWQAGHRGSQDATVWAIESRAVMKLSG